MRVLLFADEVDELADGGPRAALLLGVLGRILPRRCDHLGHISLPCIDEGVVYPPKPDWFVGGPGVWKYHCDVQWRAAGIVEVD